MPRLEIASLRAKKRWLLIPLALAALPIALKILGAKPTNRAATSPENTDASLRTRFYAAAPSQARAQVLEAVPSISTYGQKWRVTSHDDPSTIRCEVRVLVFTDDLAITIAPHDSGSRVDVTSAARVGQGDFGENARHIRQILSALDERLQQSGSSR